VTVGHVVTVEDLLAQADAAAANAYAPYSEYQVGAAVLARDGRVFAAANVENAAYPLGICAERSAIAKAASEGLRPGALESIAITGSPCGGCRQWLHEWRFEHVHFRRADATVATYTPDELLPETWDLPER
jgi:cytidine deaminase